MKVFGRVWKRKEVLDEQFKKDYDVKDLTSTTI